MGFIRNVENYNILQDHTKLRTVSMQNQSQHCQRSARSCLEQEAASDSSVGMLSTSDFDWPTPFVFPAKALPANLLDALDKQINLCNSKQRHLTRLLLQTLWTKAVKFKIHPDHHEKVEMAKTSL